MYHLSRNPSIAKSKIISERMPAKQTRNDFFYSTSTVVVVVLVPVQDATAKEREHHILLHMTDTAVDVVGLV